MMYMAGMSVNDETICTRVVFLSDGESSCDKKYITTAQTNDIIIHGIGLGGSSDDEALADMSVSTGGVFQKADKSEMLSELYEKIYIYDQFDKTDTDFDGAFDDVDYTPNEINPYISYIFYPLNGDDFLQEEAETRKKAMTNIENKTVQLMPTVSGADFKDRWDIMGLKNGKNAYRIDEVHLVYHGSPRAIGLGGIMYVYADKNKTEGIDRTYGALDGSILISDLEPKEIQYLNLSCCNNGNLDFNSNNGVPGYDDNMAISFLKSKNDIDKVTAWDGLAVYGKEYMEGYSN